MPEVTLGITDAIAYPPRAALGVGATLTYDGEVYSVTGSGFAQAFYVHPTSGLLQPSSLDDSAAHRIQTGGDDFAPCNLTWKNLGEWIGGNHSRLCWRTAKGSLATSDIGKVWASSTYRMMLLDTDATYAYWSRMYDVSETWATSSAPTGVWTRGGSPDVDFTGAALNTDRIPSSRSVEDAVAWTPGSHRMLARRVSQVLFGWDEYVTAQGASVGAKIDVSGLAGIGTLLTDWRWPGDQPGVTIIDTSLTASQALTVSQWSGMQAGRCDSGTVAMVGVTPGHPMVSWASPGSAADATPSDWSDGLPPAVAMSRNAYGGVAVGVLASSVDRSDLTTSAILVSSIGKMYPIAVGTGNGSLAAESVTTVRGFRSVTTETSNRHLHVVTDPVTGTTHWWLMAGSTGTCGHPALLPTHLGRRLVQTRGTATVEPPIRSNGVTVSVAGWAEGTVEW